MLGNKRCPPSRESLAWHLGRATGVEKKRKTCRLACSFVSWQAVSLQRDWSPGKKLAGQGKEELLHLLNLQAAAAMAFGTP